MIKKLLLVGSILFSCLAINSSSAQNKEGMVYKDKAQAGEKEKGDIVYKFPKDTPLSQYFPGGLEEKRAAEFGLSKKIPDGTEIQITKKEMYEDHEKVMQMSQPQLQKIAESGHLEGLNTGTLNHIVSNCESERAYFEFFKRYYELKQLELLHKELKKEVARGGFGPKSKQIYSKLLDKEKETKTKYEEASSERERMLKIMERQSLLKDYSDFINFAMPYGLSYEQYSKVKKLIEKDEADDKIKKQAGLEKILGYEKLLDGVASHYGINKSRIIEVMQQESAFQIRAIGPLKERGLGQFKKASADTLSKLLADKDSELYYPHFDIEGYSFKRLSSDYQLNIILEAAQVKVADDIYKSELKKLGITGKELLEFIKRKGERTKFLKLTEEKKEPYDSYSVSWKRAKAINNFWRNTNVSPDDLFYLIYNGGGGALRNIRKNTALSELLLFNLSVFLENKTKLSEYTLYHYGSIDNLIAKNKKALEGLDQDEATDLFGNFIYNAPMGKLNLYYDLGFISWHIDKRILESKKTFLISSPQYSYAVIDSKVIEIGSNEAKVIGGINTIAALYTELNLMESLERAQAELNKAYSMGDHNAVLAVSKKVKEIEKNLGRNHTGLAQIRKDKEELIKEIESQGFNPN